MATMDIPVIIGLLALNACQSMTVLWFIIAAFGSGILWGIGAALLPAILFPTSLYLIPQTSDPFIRGGLFFFYILFLVSLLIRHWSHMRAPFLAWCLLFFVTLMTGATSYFFLRQPEEYLPQYLSRLKIETNLIALEAYAPLYSCVLSKWEPSLDLTAFDRTGVGGIFKFKQKNFTGASFTDLSMPDQASLFLAIRNRNLERLRTLLDRRRIDLDRTLYHGQTPLTYAIAYGSPAVVELLVHYGADLHRPNTAQKEPLTVAKECQLHQMQTLIERLISKESFHDRLGGIPG